VVTVHPASGREAPPASTRHVSGLVADPAPASRGARVEPGPGWLVVAQAGLAERVPADVVAAGATVVHLDDHRPVEEQLADLPADAVFAHVRVLADLRGGSWPDPPSVALLIAHEALFAAAKRSRDALEAGGSLGVWLDDELRAGVPHPHGGLFTGIVKSLKWDLPPARLACVVTDRADGWDVVEREVAHDAGDPVTVHQGDRRLRVRMTPAPVDDVPLQPLRAGAVVVATGGARGITAACVRGLARRTPITVWLLGSSRLTDVPDELLQADDGQLPALRVAWLREQRTLDPGAGLRELGRRFDRLLAARESQQTLQELRAVCGPGAVRYRTCDLTDAAAVQAVADEVRATSAQIDLVLHGAGLHDGGDISRLTLDGLRRIRDVKLRGYHHLRAAFSDPEPVLFASFGSVAGLVGLNGECDYAPGNDVLHGAATYGTAALGRRELTFAWPIWSDIGMGGSELVQANNAENAIMTSLDPAEGVAHFVRELLAGPPHAPVVSYLHPREIGTFSQRFPGFVAPAEPGRRWLLGVPRQQSATTCTWTLDVSTQALPWLTHHRVAGRPTVPGAALAALAAEAAQRLLPEAAVVALHDLRLTAFVAPGRHPHTVHALLEEPVEGAAGGPRVRVRVSSDVVDPRGRLLRADRPLFECVVELGASTPVVRGAVVLPEGAPADDPTQAAASPVRLGGPFLATRETAVGPGGATAVWAPPPGEAVAGAPLPVVLLDAMIRTRLLAPSGADAAAGVPAAIERVDVHVSGDDATVAARHPGPVVLRHDRLTGLDEAVDADGHRLLRMHGLRLHELTAAASAASG
ncbi:SDR family NAD(P)-dependent oxidoreductase, partial [Angustibacter aerolatus]